MRSVKFISVLLTLVVVSVAVASISASRHTEEAKVTITNLEIGFFGISPATNISYPRSVLANSSFSISMNVVENVTRVYITTPGFEVISWHLSYTDLTVSVIYRQAAYIGILSMHVVGNIPFPVIY